VHVSLDGCSEWYVSVVFLAGQVLGNVLESLGESARQGKLPMLGKGDSLGHGVRIPKDFINVDQPSVAVP
jgi:hypothetical protein